ncbi:MAG: hypothetical protein IT305_07105 [Chloroflexi bacterium]|nr:hypothetical protein [Chloroflexota bacterium]
MDESRRLVASGEGADPQGESASPLEADWQSEFEELSRSIEAELSRVLTSGRNTIQRVQQHGVAVIRDLEARRRGAEDELEDLAHQFQEIHQYLASADDHARRIRSRAEREGADLIADARRQAEAIVADAHTRANARLEAAEREAADRLQEADNRVAEMLADARARVSEGEGAPAGAADEGWGNGGHEVEERLRDLAARVGRLLETPGLTNAVGRAEPQHQAPEHGITAASAAPPSEAPSPVPSEAEPVSLPSPPPPAPPTHVPPTHVPPTHVPPTHVPSTWQTSEPTTWEPVTPPPWDEAPTREVDVHETETTAPSELEEEPPATHAQPSDVEAPPEQPSQRHADEHDSFVVVEGERYGAARIAEEEEPFDPDARYGQPSPPPSPSAPPQPAEAGPAPVVMRTDSDRELPVGTGAVGQAVTQTLVFQAVPNFQAALALERALKAMPEVREVRVADFDERQLTFQVVHELGGHLPRALLALRGNDLELVEARPERVEFAFRG